MVIVVISILFALIIATILWRTGASEIPKEMRTSYSPQDLEVLQEDLNFRKVVGQIVIVSIALFLIMWWIW